MPKVRLAEEGPHCTSRRAWLLACQGLHQELSLKLPVYTFSEISDNNFRVKRSLNTVYIYVFFLAVNLTQISSFGHLSEFKNISV
jgi:hypothetical protein